MSGGRIFIVSLAAVITLGILFVLPALREREELAPRILRSRGTERAAVDAARRLTRALAFPRTGDPVDARLTAISREFTDSHEMTSSDLRFTLSWERVPELLEWLAVEPGPAPAELVMTATEDPGLCRVELRFAPTPPGVTPR